MDWARGREGTHETVSETDRRGKPLRTVICMETGLVRNDPIPGDAELAKFYAEDYRIVYEGAANPRRRQILHNFRQVSGHVRTFRDVLMPARRVLDVGAGSGEFAYLMGALGKQVVGIEPNVDYAAYCRDELGLDVRTEHLAPDLFGEAEFDLIRCNHVLEHLNDPVRYLAMIARWLAPEGILYVEVPNIETDCREKRPGRMFHYGHIFNFNPWTLRAAAGLAGLEECAETAGRSVDATGVFLRRGAALAEKDAVNPANAERVREIIRRHYAGVFRKGKVARRFRNLARSFARNLAVHVCGEEALTGLAAGAPRAIGSRAARTLARAVTPGGARAERTTRRPGSGGGIG